MQKAGTMIGISKYEPAGYSAGAGASTTTSMSAFDAGDAGPQTLVQWKLPSCNLDSGIRRDFAHLI
jgi:hypothetical protein